MRSFHFILLLWVSCSLRAQTAAPDTLSVLLKVNRLQDRSIGFREKVWSNPALLSQWPGTSYTDVQLSGRGEDRGLAALVQSGNTKLGWDVSARSFMRLNEEECVFGSASYGNYHVKHILWNENSDYDILYPYVTGDSIGGFMQSESYRFMGGYIRILGRYALGAQIKYRASSSYRDQDPRPQNTVSDLDLIIGGARLFGQHWLGLSLDLKSYKQTSTISFLADRGPTAVSQMLGLGSEYVRFGSTYTKSIYNQSRLGVAFCLLPKQVDQGLSVQLGGHTSTLEKHLTAANNLQLVRLNRLEGETEVAIHQIMTSRLKGGVRLVGNYEARRGKESTVGSASGSVYEVIGETDGFHSDDQSVLLKGLLSYSPKASNGLGWDVCPSIGWNRFHARHVNASKQMSMSALFSKLELEGRRVWNTKALSVVLEGGYVWNVDKNLEIPEMDSSLSVTRALVSNFNYLSDNHWLGSFKIRMDCKMRQNYVLYADMRWYLQQYHSCNNAYGGELSIGLIF